MAKRISDDDEDYEKAIESVNFKSLEKKWYQKLKEEGFTDIEDTTSDQRYLKTWHSSYFQARYHPDIFQIKAEYFRKASRFLHDWLFETSLEEEIWRLHTDGLSLRESVSELEKLGIRMNKDSVHKVVTKLKLQMKFDYFE